MSELNLKEIQFCLHCNKLEIMGEVFGIESRKQVNTLFFLLQFFLNFIYSIPTVFAQYWTHQTSIFKCQKNGFGKKILSSGRATAYDL